jgi:hypothetical protein
MVAVEGAPQYLPLMIHESEGCANLVLLDEPVDEGDGMNEFAHKRVT